MGKRGPRPKPETGIALTSAQRQAAYRARLAAEAARAPLVTQKPKKVKKLKPLSLAEEWELAVQKLAELQERYSEWLDSMRSGQEDTPTAELLNAIVDLDLDSVATAPRGFGRD